MKYQDLTSEQKQMLKNAAHQLGYLFVKNHPGSTYDEETTMWDYDACQDVVDLSDPQHKYTEHKLPMLMLIEPTFRSVPDSEG